MPTLIDLAHPIHPGTAPWPGTPSVETRFLDRAAATRPDERHSNSTRFAMNIHCGTHLDAPFHFFDTGRTVDQIPLSQTFGPATLVRLPHRGASQAVTVDDLRPHEPSLRKTRKLIVQTGWSARWLQHDFFEAHPDISVEAARWCVACGIELLGVETPSVDHAPHETHLELLGNNVVIVECLRGLEQVPGTEFLFAAIPLNLAGRDGSPVRAIAIVD